MGTFDSAFRQGQAAYHDAERSRAEIEAVFAELEAEILAATGGTVTLELGPRIDNLLQAGSTTLVSAMRGVLPEQKPYDALFARRTGTSWGSRSELCSVKVAPSGYPVDLTYPGEFVQARDRNSLVQALTGLLRHPTIAGKIERVSRLVDETAASTSRHEALPAGDGSERDRDE